MNATWSKVTAGGPFLGSAQLAKDRLDPYWWLADVSGYADYGGTLELTLPVLLELRKERTVAELRGKAGDTVSIPAAYRDGRFCTAQVSPAFIQDLGAGRALEGWVERMELGLPITPPRQGERAAPFPPTFPAGTTTEVVFGVIDTGCAFAHPSLCTSNSGLKSRVRYLWDQESSPEHPDFSGYPFPPDLGYGRELSQSCINKLLKGLTPGSDAAAIYEQVGYRLMRKAHVHGMHVLDTLCGPLPPKQRMGRDPQSALQRKSTDTPVIFVQLPRKALEDASGAWLCVHVLDALRYMLARTGSNERLIVNLSYGSQLGPHDGSTTLEQAILALCEEVNRNTDVESSPRLRVVFAGGNSFARRAHASSTLKAGATVKWTWQVPPDNEAPSFAELWMPPGAKVEVSLTPPGGVGSGPVAPGEHRRWNVGSGTPPLAEVCAQHSSACGDGVLTLLRVGPTATQRLRGSWRDAPAGRWTVSIVNKGDQPVDVHGYLSRNDPDMGQPRGSRNAHWADPEDDPQRFLRSARDDGGNQGYLRRRGTLNWHFSDNSPWVFVVGGHVKHPGHGNDPLDRHAPYASAGPARAGASIGLRASLPSDESPVLRGLRAAGTRTASTFRLVGTSVSAPQLARRLGAGHTPSRVQNPIDADLFGVGNPQDPPD